ncbi:FAD-binding oxidoreductase [Mucilaginibacter conchicola]|uniref:FAD-binding oxidoreductase n=1 Tax=Mucilaginibacter conchicola TaxID=2303333 RepID=A0A372NTQ1_9SPHI|nr:FAD-dependent oxidoreductase [Mucilaginibacter conchicola]RFZ92615.1 FAD-binding oxidoreductase [Mucilaginibacter conchicola]
MDNDNFSYWERTAFTGRADVIIIGSGIVGLNAALHLKTTEPNLKVLVLEQGFLPSGASTKNAGFACFGTVSEQLDALKTLSENELASLANYKWRGLQRMRQNLGDKAIDYHQHGGYELFLNNEQAQANRAFENIDHLNKILKPAIDGHDIYAVADAKIAGFGFAGVKYIIYNPFEGQIHTGKMMRALLHKVYEKDVVVLNNCAVRSIQNEGSAVVLQTSAGAFKAGKVILATNAFARQLYSELSVVPGRGQVLVTKPVPGLKLKGTYHFNEGYYYFRNIDGRVLFGGGRNLDFKAEETTAFGHTQMVQEKLTDYLRGMILPDTDFEIDYWWSGIMGFGEELKPIVKELEPNIFCAVRCNGMGVAMGTLVGEEVARLVIRA